MAGAEGIEPSNAGIKIQCLTTWRRPNPWSGGGPYRGGQRLSTRRKCKKRPGKVRKFQCFWSVAGEEGHGYKGPPARQAKSAVRHRRVAQPGRALRSGRRGRRFESSLSDQIT